MKLSKKVAASIAALTISSGLLTACAESTDGSNASGESKTLKVSTVFGPDHWHTKAFEAYAESVTEATGGSVNFEYFYGDSLVPTSETTNALANGTIDISFALLSYDPARFPISSWIAESEFMGGKSPDAGVMQKVGATIDWSMNNEAYQKELKDAGLFGLIPRMPSHSAYGLMCTDDSATLNDVSKKRVRVAGKAWSDEAQNLGMVPVDLPASEAFTSFQQGLIDCFMGGATDVDSLGLTQLGGTFNQAQLTGYSANGLMMSDNTWQSLSSEQQDAMWENLDVYLKAWYTGYREKNFEFVKNAADNGVEIVVPDDEMAKKIESHHSDVLNELGSDAPASVADGKQMIADIESTFGEWETKIADLGFSSEDSSWADFANRVDGKPEDITPVIELIKSEVLDEHKPNA